MRSLVTACMNRDHHLRRSLPHWLALPGIDEIVIVDWSNRTPLRDLAAIDPRVRVLRVENEARWVLSYAYNFGISRARGDIILKCDADCLPSAKAVAAVPGPAGFHAGHWRQGRQLGKACVNGQCLFTRAQFEAVNGYSELLRVYGRDDEDFYERLVGKGFARLDIPAAEFDFIDHSHEDRVANQGAPGTVLAGDGTESVEAFLHRQTPFHEMSNLVVSHFMPWGIWYPRARYIPLSFDGKSGGFRRDTLREIPLSDALLQQARGHGLVAVVTQLFKLPPAEAARLDHARCLQLLSRHLATRRSSQSPFPVPATP